MKTHYKFIHFVRLPHKPEQWACVNNKTQAALGAVDYETQWKQFVFWTGNEDAIFSHDCLTDIADFLKQLNHLTAP